MRDEVCPYGVYVLKCETYPGCVCGRHIARAAQQGEQTERNRVAEMHDNSTSNWWGFNPHG